MEPEARVKDRPGATRPGGGILSWTLVMVAGYLGLLLALGAPSIFAQPLKAGDIADRDLISPRPVEVVDEYKTRLARDKARESVLPVVSRNRELDRRMLARLEQVLDQVGMFKSRLTLPLPAPGLTPREQVYLIECPEEAWQRLKADKHEPQASPSGGQGLYPEVESSLRIKLGQLLNKSAARSRHRVKAEDEKSAGEIFAAVDKARAEYRSLNQSGDATTHDMLLLAATVDPRQWPAVRETIARATRRLLQTGPLFPGVSPSDWEQALIEYLPDSWPERLSMISARVIASVLEPNVVVDAEATRLKQDSAVKKVGPVMRQIDAGDVIVPRGGMITADQLAMLKAAGITHTTNWPLVASLALSLLAAFAFIGVFMYTYEPKHLFSPFAMGLIWTVCVVTFGIAAFAGQDYPQFVPVPAAALVLTVFFGPRLAAVVTLMLMVFLQVDSLIGFDRLVALGTASCAAIGADIKQRRQLMLRGFLIGLLQAGGYLAVAILTQSIVSASALGVELTLQLLGGLSSCIVAIGSLPFLESIFGMITPFRLAELTDPNQLLLRRLEENAPGTYQHSLAVANLAEAGARAIGADVNLVRAGALYHDIGKMVRPRYFIENQLGDKNPHDTMSPEESRDRVLAHVTDGLSLARKYDLPKAVQDFIPQHQGTTLMAYFYHKACQRDGPENVDPGFYRYPGPRPQCREAAIVMLADVSEAVTHSMKDPSQDEVEATIDKVFKARWEDGQFSESGLTANELERVKKAFVRVWRTLHHERLKYPSTTTGRMPVPPEQPPSAKASSVGEPAQQS